MSSYRPSTTRSRFRDPDLIRRHRDQLTQSVFREALSSGETLFDPVQSRWMPPRTTATTTGGRDGTGGGAATTEPRLRFGQPPSQTISRSRSNDNPSQSNASGSSTVSGGSTVTSSAPTAPAADRFVSRSTAGTTSTTSAPPPPPLVVVASASSPLHKSPTHYDAHPALQEGADALIVEEEVSLPAPPAATQVVAAASAPIEGTDLSQQVAVPAPVVAAADTSSSLMAPDVSPVRPAEELNTTAITPLDISNQDSNQDQSVHQETTSSARQEQQQSEGSSSHPPSKSESPGSGDRGSKSPPPQPLSVNALCGESSPAAPPVVQQKNEDVTVPSAAATASLDESNFIQRETSEEEPDTATKNHKNNNSSSSQKYQGSLNSLANNYGEPGGASAGVTGATSDEEAPPPAAQIPGSEILPRQDPLPQETGGVSLMEGRWNHGKPSSPSPQRSSAVVDASSSPRTSRPPSAFENVPVVVCPTTQLLPAGPGHRATPGFASLAETQHATPQREEHHPESPTALSLPRNTSGPKATERGAIQGPGLPEGAEPAPVSPPPPQHTPPSVAAELSPRTQPGSSTTEQQGKHNEESLEGARRVPRPPGLRAGNSVFPPADGESESAVTVSSPKAAANQVVAGSVSSPAPDSDFNRLLSTASPLMPDPNENLWRTLRTERVPPPQPQPQPLTPSTPGSVDPPSTMPTPRSATTTPTPSHSQYSNHGQFPGLNQSMQHSQPFASRTSPPPQQQQYQTQSPLFFTSSSPNTRTPASYGTSVTRSAELGFRSVYESRTRNASHRLHDDFHRKSQSVNGVLGRMEGADYVREARYKASRLVHHEQQRDATEELELQDRKDISDFQIQMRQVICNDFHRIAIVKQIAAIAQDQQQARDLIITSRDIWIGNLELQFQKSVQQLMQKHQQKQDRLSLQFDEGQQRGMLLDLEAQNFYSDFLVVEQRAFFGLERMQKAQNEQRNRFEVEDAETAALRKFTSFEREQRNFSSQLERYRIEMARVRKEFSEMIELEETERDTLLHDELEYSYNLTTRASELQQMHALEVAQDLEAKLLAKQHTDRVDFVATMDEIRHILEIDAESEFQELIRAELTLRHELQQILESNAEEVARGKIVQVQLEERWGDLDQELQRHFMEATESTQRQRDCIDQARAEFTAIERLAFSDLHGVEDELVIKEESENRTHLDKEVEASEFTLLWHFCERELVETQESFERRVNLLEAEDYGVVSLFEAEMAARFELQQLLMFDAEDEVRSHLHEEWGDQWMNLQNVATAELTGCQEDLFELQRLAVENREADRREVIADSSGNAPQFSSPMASGESIRMLSPRGSGSSTSPIPGIAATPLIASRSVHRDSLSMSGWDFSSNPMGDSTGDAIVLSPGIEAAQSASAFDDAALTSPRVPRQSEEENWNNLLNWHRRRVREIQKAGMQHDDAEERATMEMEEDELRVTIATLQEELREEILERKKWTIAKLSLFEAHRKEREVISSEEPPEWKALCLQGMTEEAAALKATKLRKEKEARASSLKELREKALASNRPFMGFSLAEKIDPKAHRKSAAQLKADSQKPVEPKLLIDSMYLGGPAHAQGLELNDVVVRLGGELVTNLEQTRKTIKECAKVGKTLEVVIRRKVSFAPSAPSPAVSPAASPPASPVESPVVSPAAAGILVKTGDRAAASSSPLGPTFLCDVTSASPNDSFSEVGSTNGSSSAGWTPGVGGLDMSMSRSCNAEYEERTMEIPVKSINPAYIDLEDLYFDVGAATKVEREGELGIIKKVSMKSTVVSMIPHLEGEEEPTMARSQRRRSQTAVTHLRPSNDPDHLARSLGGSMRRDSLALSSSTRKPPNSHATASKK